MSEEKEFQGRVGSIDMEKRVLSMKDAEDVVHPFKWTEPLDIIMRKWKPGYYLTVKYDDESRTLKNAVYWQEGKDVMPKKQGGRPFQPRNDKAIIHEVTYQELHATFRQWLILQTEPVTFEKLLIYSDSVCDKSKVHAKVLIQEAGVQ